MKTYMARLGSFSFGIDTAAFQELQRSSAYRWQAKERIGRRPAQQNTGREAETINLSGVIYPHYRGGLKQMAELRAQAEAALPLPLIYAFETVGQYCGLWCITTIEETRTVFFDNGAPRKIEFRMTLVEYGEDVPAPEAAIAAIAAASTTETPVDTAAVAKDAAATATAAKKVSTLDQAKAMIAKAAETAKNVADAAKKAVDTVLNSEAVQLAKAAYKQVQDVKAAIKGMQSAIKQVEGIIDDPSTALTALGNLSASAGTLSDATGVTALTLGPTATSYNGETGSSLHEQQVNQGVTASQNLSAAASSVQDTSDTLRGFF